MAAAAAVWDLGILRCFSRNTYDGVGALECEVEVSMENYDNVESAMISFPCELTPCEVTELLVQEPEVPVITKNADPV